jgi:hypothetical protein
MKENFVFSCAASPALNVFREDKSKPSEKPKKQRQRKLPFDELVCVHSPNEGFLKKLQPKYYHTLLAHVFDVLKANEQQLLQISKSMNFKQIGEPMG